MAVIFLKVEGCGAKCREPIHRTI